MRGSQWLIKIYILYVMEIKIIQKIIFKLTIKCKCLGIKCRDSLSDVFFFTIIMLILYIFVYLLIYD